MPLIDCDDSAEGVDFKLGRAGTLIDSAFSNCVEGQEMRELVQNALEAGATLIQICRDLTHLAACVREGRTPVHRLAVWDNGKGMSAKSLRDVLLTLHVADPTKGLDKNLGIGARVSLIPANPHGVVFMSWQNGVGHMIRIRQFPDGNYRMHVWDQDLGTTVVPVPVEYNTHFDGTKREHGTLVICWGDGEECNTYLRTTTGTGLRKNRTVLRLLNTRFWTIPDGVKVEMWDPSGFKGQWPTEYGRTIFHDPKLRVVSSEDVSEINLDADDDTDLNLDRSATSGSQWRSIFGMARYLGKQKYVADQGILNVPGAKVHWFVYKDDRSASGNLQCHNHNGYAPVPGRVGVLWNNEVYNYDSGADKFNRFGVIFRSARQRLAFIMEPTNVKDIRTDAARSKIGLGHGVDFPWSEWGRAFSDKKPEAVRALLAEVTPVDTEFDEESVRQEIADYLEQNGVFVYGNRAPSGDGKPKGASGGGGGTNPRPSSGGSGDHPRRIAIPKLVISSDDANPKYIMEPDIFEGRQMVTLNLNHAFIKDKVARFAEGAADGAESKLRSTLARLLLRRIGTSVVMALLFRSKYKGCGEGWSETDVNEKLISAESLTFAVLDMVDLDNLLRQYCSGMLPTAASAK